MGTQVYISVEKANEHLVLDGSLSLLDQLLDTFRGRAAQQRDAKRGGEQPRRGGEEQPQEVRHA